jgi:hypothetical protein
MQQAEKSFRYYNGSPHLKSQGTWHTIAIRIRTRDIDSRQHHFTRDKVTGNIFMDGTLFLGAEEIPGEFHKQVVYPRYVDSVLILWDNKPVPLKNILSTSRFAGVSVYRMRRPVKMRTYSCWNLRAMMFFS